MRAFLRAFSRHRRPRAIVLMKINLDVPIVELAFLSGRFAKELLKVGVGCENVEGPCVELTEYAAHFPMELGYLFSLADSLSIGWITYDLAVLSA